MSCPNCGCNLGSLRIFPMLLLMIVLFTLSIVILPYELFFLSAIVVLVGLRSIEKRINKFETKRAICPRCGFNAQFIHTH
ncbi:MAG: hypothetical protein H3C35_01465 [Bacteroidetes bacterium]|nr:hypothetical protein [Bacteroidota bacterium]